jgi:hypothetical protein
MQQSSGLGAQAQGEFSWTQIYSTLSSYYSSYSSSRLLLGSAYAGFNDFYGTNGNPNTFIDTTVMVNGVATNTLSATLNLCKTHRTAMLGIQLATWNDFTEGTILEPTVERGFQSLVTIQKFTGVPFTQHNLEEIYKLFTLRKQYNGNTAIQLALNTASCEFSQLDTLDAQAMIDCIASTGTATGCGGTVPLNLVSFSGEIINSTSQLQWHTADESSTNRFEIERSVDALNFTPLSEIIAAGSGNNNYRFTDEQPLRGKNYYRLKIIRDDGSFIYSNIILLQMVNKSGHTVVIFPNPVGKQLTIQYDNAGNDAILNIFNLCGQKVMAINANGQNQKTIDVSNLAGGTYMLEVNSSTEKMISKFVKIN